MTYVLGLTGSIGMGKSTTAGFFRDAGVPVWDADAVVHKLYSKGGLGVCAIEMIAPAAIINGKVDRAALRDAILADSNLLKRVETVIHPLVAANRQAFLGAINGLVVCDIPLLYETGAEKWLDGVLVVTASPQTQRTRVLVRENMTKEVFEAILSKQTPDSEKCQRADFIIDTGKGMDHARTEVLHLIKKLEAQNA